jgi:hypothetical protein
MTQNKGRFSIFGIKRFRFKHINHAILKLKAIRLTRKADIQCTTTHNFIFGNFCGPITKSNIGSLYINPYMRKP